MSNKLFSDRLNKELDNIGVPQHNEERIEAFSKLIKIPRFKAEAFLNGVSIPEQALLIRLAQELEVNSEWLIGRSEHKPKKAAQD